MNNAVIVSYASALILLYFCVLLYSLACKHGEGLYAKLIGMSGVLPGVTGVIYGFYLFLTLEDRRQGLAVMTAWLLLEMGALQLKRLAK
jgi:hypothetical protein